MATGDINCLKWSEETYRLDEVSSKFKLPILVRVSEGIYGGHESETFSASDIIKLEKEETLQKVAAHFIDNMDEWSSQLGSCYEQYVSLNENMEILVPLRYKGLIQMVQEEKIYNSVLELSLAFPKYAKVLKNLEVPKAKGKIILHAGIVLEIERKMPDEFGNNTLLCKYDWDKTKCFVQLPIRMKGKFKSQKDETKYTLQQIIDNFELPQAVRFVEEDINEVYSRDLVGGVENMVHMSGTLSINRLVMQKVLIGYYKGLETGPTKQTNFCRRPVVVLPLDSSDLQNIEVSVAVTLSEDDSIYDFVMTNNFSRDKTVDLAIVDGSLYAEFAKHPKVLILDEKNTSGVVANDDVYEEFDQPPVPPRLKKADSTKKETTNHDKSKAIFDKDGYLSPRTTKTKPGHKNYDEVNPIGGMSLADIEFHADYTNMYVKSGLPSSLKKVSGKVKKFFARKEQTESSIEKESVSSPDEGEDQTVYDYPDVSKMDVTFGTKPVAHVSPQTQAHLNKPGNHKFFKELTVCELSDRLRLCGLDELGKVCKKEMLDGKFIAGLSDKELKTEPFCLTDIQKRKLRDMVNKNWIPKV